MASAASFITAIAPSSRDPSLVRVAMNDVEIGVLLRATVDALGLRVGLRVSSSMVTKISAARDLTAARAAALKLLARSDRSRATLLSQLIERGHSEHSAEAAVARLVEDGWVDDARYASERARRIVERRPVAHASVEASLAQEGIPLRVASSAADAHAPIEGDAARAVALARQTLRSTSGTKGTLDEKSIRRAAGSLARAGFDADTIAAALVKVGGRAAARIAAQLVER